MIFNLKRREVIAIAQERQIVGCLLIDCRNFSTYSMDEPLRLPKAPRKIIVIVTVTTLFSNASSLNHIVRPTRPVARCSILASLSNSDSVPDAGLVLKEISSRKLPSICHSYDRSIWTSEPSNGLLVSYVLYPLCCPLLVPTKPSCYPSNRACILC